MKILVYGAGAVGGYLAARLMLAGNRVYVLDRPEAAAQIGAGGLIVSEAGQTERVDPPTFSDLHEAFAESPPYDLVILGMKSYDLDGIREPLVQMCPEPTHVLTLQNGIGVEAPFIQQLGAGRVVAASFTTPVSKKESNVLVVERSGRGLGLAPTVHGHPVGRWVALFAAAGITTIELHDYESMKWSKALLNMVSNASSAILNMTPGQVYDDSRLFDLELQMLREMLAIMARRRLHVVDLPGSPAAKLALAIKWVPRLLLEPFLGKIVAGGRGEKMPSFHIDLESGRGQSEVIYHNGAVVAAGAALGIPAPVNKTLNHVLWRLTTGELDRRSYDHNPQRLLDDVRREKAGLKN